MRHSRRIDMYKSDEIVWGDNEYLRPHDPPIMDYKLPFTTFNEMLKKNTKFKNR